MKSNENETILEDTESKRKKKDRFFQTRNILNIIFMLVAIIGMIIYFFANHTIGTIVVLVAMVFKMIECSLRFLH